MTEDCSPAVRAMRERLGLDGDYEEAPERPVRKSPVLREKKIPDALDNKFLTRP